jgi:N utilization substance protein B
MAASLQNLSPSARAIALQMLYALDAGTEYSVDNALPLLRSVLLTDAEEHAISLDDFDDAVPLVRAVVEARPGLDETIRKHSKSWRLERMAQVDRNLLRMMLFVGRESGKSHEALAQASELAKQFGTTESVAFVSGLLERCFAR